MSYGVKKKTSFLGNRESPFYEFDFFMAIKACFSLIPCNNSFNKNKSSLTDFLFIVLHTYLLNISQLPPQSYEVITIKQIYN